MKKIIGVIAIVLGISVLGVAWGETRYVDASAGQSGDGRSWGTAFQTIQEGIDAASDGDTVIVAEGIYVERVHFHGKNIVLRSTDPLAASVVENTIIDGNWAHPVVTFSGTEDETCVISGFTLRNGGNGGGICGGDTENHTRATIQNNTIANSNAAQGAGIAYCDGTIQNNIITGNYSWNAAGGLTECDGVIQNNVISGNGSFADDAAGGLTHCNGLIQSNVISGNSSSSMGLNGGGLAHCNGTIQNNTITGNAVNTGGGGGLYRCDGTIQNNVITKNSAMHGGGVAYCDGTIQGNTISENEFGGLYNCGGAIQNNLITAHSGDAVAGCNGPIQNNTIADNSGWALRECGGMIVNCIIWGNTEGRVDQLFETSEPMYSCIEHWAGGGEGNTSLYPHFVDPEAGDYHLQSWSPCIDEGYPASDFSNEPEPNGGRVNMGAYGNSSVAASKSPDTDADGLPDDWEMDRFGNLEEDSSGDADGDGIPNITEYRYGWDPGAAAERRVENLTKGKWYQTIQVALHEAEDGDEIMVHPGVYEEKISFWGKNVVLRSTDPSDTNVVAATVINGGESGPTVTFAGTEDETCVLTGFTIRHSDGYCGGGGAGWGICGGTTENHTHATIRHNLITKNKGEIGGGLVYCDGLIENNNITGNGAWAGAGLADCDGTIRNNTITANLANWSGGGLSGCDGTIENNIISDNMGHGGGGGLSGCGGLIQDNVITGNWTEQDESAGGGLEGCNGTIRNNIISGNRTRCHGAGGLSSCGGTIENNVISHNWSDGAGGGLSDCNGEIVNNTIVGNRGWSGGLSNCTGIIRNCIIWGNAPVHMPQMTASSQPTYSCVQHWPGGGEGNIGDYPYFADPEAGNYHLESWSPCIDSGDPASDFSKEPQPNGGRVNMGAYGNTPEAASKSPDTDSDSLPDDWELHWFSSLEMDGAADPDGDQIPNSTEYRRGWDATAASETLAENVTTAERYQTIQDAICEADDGDEIVVYPGVYRENLNFLGKNVVLRSTDPWDGGVVANTILEGNESGAVITFSGTEDETCVLAGFTIRNGNGSYDGGGIWGGGTHATIRDNVITGNSGDQGGGLRECNGMIRNNVIYGNSAAYGGGLAYCHGTIQNCTITGNSAVKGMGGALHDCGGTIVNCIIWGNTDKPGFQMSYSSEPTYSCIQSWVEGGEGNVPFNPHFVDPENGDFHLRSWSLCIDAGDPSSDFSNEPAPNGGRVNIGAYGNTPEAASKCQDTDTDGLPDEWELHWFADLQGDGDSDPDGDRIPDVIEWRYGWNPKAKSETLVENQTQELGYESIRLALWESADGDEIVVHPGLYLENIIFSGKNVVLKSTDPSNATVVARTIIDGGHLGSVVAFDGSEDETCVLSGFTIQNGEGDRGGGIHGESTQATIHNNVITRNLSDYSYGGGVHGCNGTIENNTIAENSCRWGGGLAECHGTIQNNIIAENYAHRLGGGLYACNGTIQNNTLVSNTAWFGGGGLCGCIGTIRNCIMWSNTAPHGPQVKDSTKPTYSCIQGWTDYGEGNIVVNPQFFDAENGNFRLMPSSPCIDAGFNHPDLPETDIAGMHRIMYGGKSLTVDMGAYEYYVNDVEVASEGVVTLTWSSLSGKSYSVYRSSDLMIWELAADSVASMGNAVTTWVDPLSLVPSTANGVTYYRIRENE